MTEENNDQQHDIESTPVVVTPARTSTLMGPRAKLAFTFVLVAGALAYFAFTAFQGATVDYLSVEQASTQSPTAVDRQVGVIGKLVQDSYVRDADGLTAHFSIKDEDGLEELDITYTGEIGQVFFNDHSEIILQGQKLADGSFTADNLTVRCPSKYLTEAEQAEIEAQNNGDPAAPPYQPDYFDQEA
ncbi:MAG TPA: cytochrome c maturation protein CcmE [Dehalococcoidia bacterium]|jgi:cytochrome c-type biogenesis protein CcmE|nr:cytochrome c maturation protein CcmE [Dehalococcoidia bacterium]HIK89913.1 cytochrome c maturation protein CcmE [Dehalococcoidia bacterium]